MKKLLVVFLCVLLICLGNAMASETTTCPEGQHSYGELGWDADYHWYNCNKCGEKFEVTSHWAYCRDTTVCGLCGMPCNGSTVGHDWKNEIQHDEVAHWTECNDCGYRINEEKHGSSCKNPGVCGACGITYSGGEVIHQIDWNRTGYEGDQHWYLCALCDAPMNYDEHRATCDNPNACNVCGAPCSGELLHYFSFNDPLKYDENEHWYECQKCKEPVYPAEHTADCRNPGACSSCGAAYSGEVSHVFDDNSQKYDEENHWLECKYCHEKQNVFSHYNSCVDAEHCVACGAPYKGSEGGQHVGDSSKSGHNETHHWVGCAYCDGYAVYVEHFNTCGPNGNSTECVCGYPYSGFVKHFYKEGVCTRCGEAEPHEHSWTLVSTIDATCESAGVKEYKCACGETKRETYSSATGHDWVTTNQAATCQEAGYEKTACTRCGQFTQTEIPALFHNWKQSEKVAADCTKAGYIKYTCTDCGYFKKDVIPSVGHNFGEYKASGNGIHFAECQNGCGEKLEGACTYQETDAGKTCSVCEDVIAATPVPAQESTPAPAEDAGLPNAEPVIIEEAALESAAENVLPEKAVDVELIVEEQPELTPDNEEIQQALAEQPAALQELIITTVEENPEAVILNITLVVDEEKVEPKGTLRISLPAEKLQGMRLVYLTGDGMMVEIEFEIVDGKAIFETDVLGFFALIPV